MRQDPDRARDGLRGKKPARRPLRRRNQRAASAAEAGMVAVVEAAAGVAVVAVGSAVVSPRAAAVVAAEPEAATAGGKTQACSARRSRARRKCPLLLSVSNVPARDVAERRLAPQEETRQAGRNRALERDTNRKGSFFTTFFLEQVWHGGNANSSGKGASPRHRSAPEAVHHGESKPSFGHGLGDDFIRPGFVQLPSTKKNRTAASARRPVPGLRMETCFQG